MRIFVVATLFAVAGCHPQQQSSEPSVPQAEAVLVIHWAADGGDYSREYRTMDSCQVARQVVLEDTARRTQIAADVTKKQGVSPRPAAIPVPLCLPT